MRLILPAALDTVLDEKASEKLKLIPLSDNMVSRRIWYIAQNLEEQLIARLKSAKDFGIQLLVYVRYVWQGEFVEDLLCCLTFPAFNSRLFEALCTEIGAEHTHLLFHTEVRWLSKDRVFSRVYELRDEIRAFLTEKLSPLASSFSDEKWLLSLSYLADIFSDNIFRHSEQIQAFQKSLELKSSSYFMFPTMMKHIEENGVSKKMVADLMCLMQSHLDALMGNFCRYIAPEKFNELKDMRWVKNPFNFETPDLTAGLNLTPSEESEMLQLTCDGTLKTHHKTEKLSSFWINLSTEYLMLSIASISLLLPFTTTYMSETGFSVLTKMKTKE
uniref:HAT C-terminal dimerisation domain-containing protein n=1 Tax=Sinocyclocheilus anshuiensis TaxID=1608454 RepID=A0A671Q9B6_9TELE